MAHLLGQLSKGGLVMAPNQETAYQQEREKLQRTLQYIGLLLEEKTKKPRYVGDDFTEQVLDDMNERLKEHLQRAIKEPYFGRLDFHEEGTEPIVPYYLGKVGIMDDSSKEPIVIDWRAPLASLFYSFSGEEELAYYRAPEGMIEGTIHLKRNIVIREQQLLRVVDSFVKGELNVSGTDEFLLYKLGERKDNRLRDIVSTIQQEQNEIIRSPKDTALIIQGVAGSGKTTVALHRLAYLLYEYREQIRPERMMIFAPSTMFLDYISDVLPELGVGDIQQGTFATWALDHLVDELTLKDMSERYERWFEHPGQTISDLQTTSARFKGSIRFKEIIEAYLQELERLSLPAKEFTAWEGTSLDVNTLQTWYNLEYRSYPLLQRKERIIARIKRWIESELKEVQERQLVKEYKKKANQRLRTLAKQWLGQSPYELYQELINPTKRSAAELAHFAQQIPDIVRQETQQAFKAKLIEHEDLAPLLFMQFKLAGFERKERFDHVVIDEAQDFSAFQVDVLKEVLRGNSFTILGDLAQGIHSYQGTLNWNEFTSLFPKEQTSYFELKQSYRSTMEIIEFANQMLRHTQLDVARAIPVFRSGEQVKLVQLDTNKLLPFLASWTTSMQRENYQSMAIVTRTEQQAKQLHEELLATGVHATLIDAQRQEYTGGLSIVPVYLTKGLEFDAVLLLEVNADLYPPTDQNAKLLYVGCTRALHQLWITYGQQPASFLQDLDQESYRNVNV